MLNEVTSFGIVKPLDKTVLNKFSNLSFFDRLRTALVIKLGQAPANLTMRDRGEDNS